MKKNTSEAGRQTLYVEGMHCSACETLVATKLSDIKGVAAVAVSRGDGTVKVSLKNSAHALDLEAANEQLAAFGYRISDRPPDRAEVSGMSFMGGVLVLILLGVLFLILEDSQILMRFTVDQSSSLLGFFLLGVVASISSCAAIVGGILLAVSGRWTRSYGNATSGIRRAEPFVSFHVGRLLSFVSLGAALGLFGSFVQISLSLTAILIIMASAIMLILGLEMLGVPGVRFPQIPMPKFLTRRALDTRDTHGRYAPFVTGFFTFFIPCGFTLMAQSMAVASGDAVRGGLIMLAFAIGTLPALAGINAVSLFFTKHAQLKGTFYFIVAILILLMSIYNISSQLNILGLPSLSDLSRRASVQSANRASDLGVVIREENGVQTQYVTMEAREFSYFPEALTLQAGIPTKLTVHNTQVVGCAQAMYLGGLSDEILYLNVPEARAEFTPKAGTYKISCTMGMVQPVIVTVTE